jgi:hypothetical protein
MLSVAGVKFCTVRLCPFHSLLHGVSLLLLKTESTYRQPFLTFHIICCCLLSDHYESTALVTVFYSFVSLSLRLYF